MTTHVQMIVLCLSCFITTVLMKIEILVLKQSYPLFKALVTEHWGGNPSQRRQDETWRQNGVQKMLKVKKLISQVTLMKWNYICRGLIFAVHTITTGKNTAD